MAIFIAAGMMALTAVSQISAAKAAAREADRRRENEMAAANSKYASTQDSINMMKGAVREETYNAQLEVLRAGAESSRDVKAATNKVISQSLAKSEGLTSGRSAGRSMMTLQLKASKAVSQSNITTTNQISQLVSAKDKANNDLNNKLLSAHQELSAVLSTPGQIYQQNVANLVAGTASAGIQGYQLGKGIELNNAQIEAAKGAST